ncbi:hypothetical protein PACTADRAFT_77517 [Pachysolen tannophilus NRRL Y-2460]|uniref:Dolichyl-phosphate-mannose--protein mannosyltransferase n=1 Tax=Pachysolen tannophilus NRRL Y-2460 TaxID=669874 RepID=A0A1E4TN44_PACTA|nr:hypothetical protein PACTADRAFT_77517 [Pachysolen tannophilus NRRL Y-2460]
MIGNSSHLRKRHNYQEDVGTINSQEISNGEKKIEKLKLGHSSQLCKIMKFLESVIAPILITYLSLQVRFFEIDKSKNVVWDEAHFGKFGSQYLKHTFYHDVHPVLGKMLIGLSGYLANYNGSFDFESGKAYPEYVDFVAMRKFNSLFSVFVAPLAYYTSKTLGFGILTNWLVAIMVIYETSYVALSKFILLDSMLLFFTATTFYCLTKIHQLRKSNKEFTFKWYSWLILSGISVGCVCSVKWVGLFVTILFGLYTILDLATKHYDLTLSRKKYLLHWIIRIFTLILIPILFYLFCFKIHFSLLYKNGEGSKSMSTLFQVNLEDNDIEKSPRELYFGSKISIRSQGLTPNLLHSHVQTYPEGSNQQQITTYAYKDDNNNWIIHYPRTSKVQINPDTYANLTSYEKIVEGSIIRLNHDYTKANLHSHAIEAPISKRYYECSGYGNLLVGDEKDDWIIEIVEQLKSPNKTYSKLYENSDEFNEIVHPISTSFRLRNKVLGCYLATTGYAYPSWGFSQGEVVCKDSWFKRDKSTWWNIEDHENLAFEMNLEKDLLYTPPKSKFWRDFVMINLAMAASNNALVPDYDKLDELASSAWEWPILHVGLRMCGWANSATRYFLLSNPITTWSSTLSLIIFSLLTLYKIFQWQRQNLNYTEEELWFYIIAGVFPILGWSLNFFPFAIMSRVTYVHHYEPALYFAIFENAFLVEYFFKNLKHKLKNRYLFVLKLIIYAIGISSVVWCFWVFSPICFGMVGKKENYKHLEWIKTWRIT